MTVNPDKALTVFTGHCTNKNFSSPQEGQWRVTSSSGEVTADGIEKSGYLK